MIQELEVHLQPTESKSPLLFPVRISRHDNDLLAKHRVLCGVLPGILETLQLVLADDLRSFSRADLQRANLDHLEERFYISLAVHHLTKQSFAVSHL